MSVRGPQLNRCASGIAVDAKGRIWVVTMTRQLKKEEQVGAHDDGDHGSGRRPDHRLQAPGRRAGAQDDGRLQARGLRRRRRAARLAAARLLRRRHLHLTATGSSSWTSSAAPSSRNTGSRAEHSLFFQFPSGRPTKPLSDLISEVCYAQSFLEMRTGHRLPGGRPARRGGGRGGRAGKAQDRLHLPEGLRGDLPGRPGRPDPGGQGLAAVRQALRRIRPRPRRRRERGLRLLLRDPGSLRGRGMSGPSRAPTSPSTAATTSGATSSTSSAPSSASASASGTCGTRAAR